MKKLSYTLILLFHFTHVFSQEIKPLYKEYKWDNKPSNIEMISEDTASSGILLDHNVIIEYFYDNNDNLIEYKTVHKRVKLNTQKAIRQNNKVYIDLNNTKELLTHKARVIRPDGTIIELKESDFKQAENFEEYGKFKYFAFEGIDIGSDIEYFYTISKNPYYYGSRWALQSSIPHLKVSFTLSAPKHLIYKTLGRNGFPSLTLDTADTNRNIWRAEMSNIPALKSEPYSAYDTQLMSLQFKLQKNTANGKDKITAYGDAARSVYDKTHEGTTSADHKKLLGLSKKLKLDKKSLELKVRGMETYLKSNISIVDANDERLVSIPYILDKKSASEIGIIRVLLAWFEAEGIKYELMLCSDRTEELFEKDFETYGSLDEYFIYIPEIDKYIAPTFYSYRLGLLPYSWAHNYALFMKPITIGTFTTFIGEVKWVPISDYTKSLDDHQIELDLSDLEEPILSFTRATTGYESVYFQANLKNANEQRMNEFKDLLISYINDEEEIISSNFENIELNDIQVKPFIVKGKVSYPNLIEKVGPKYLVKIGKVIGPQSELYQENQRKMPVELNNNHGYKREIVLKVPSGYKLQNLEKLNFNKKVSHEGKEVMAFNSSYIYKDNLLTVNVLEYYNTIQLPVEKYNEFKEVINAAADFNKVVLVLEQ
jgi:hypothetical protein